MKLTTEYSAHLTEKILELEAKLENLEKEIHEIGQPAGQELQRRLNMLKIEESALKRNFEESLRKGEPDSIRMEKIEALLHHIEREEAAVEHEADFLHQAAPSSMTLAVEAGARMVDLYRRGVKAVIGDHHPLGESVFVNHSHENLRRECGVTSGDWEAPEKPEDVKPAE
jgi:predicted RNase H-like nuclease (RuvC/YqgF family)